MDQLRARLIPLLTGPWTKSACHVGGEPPIRWLHVATIENLHKVAPPINLGLSDRGYWVLWWVREDIRETAALEYPPGRNCTFLWPLLERSPYEVFPALAGGLQSIGLPPEWLQLFPLDELVACALESHSDGWFGDACRWLENMPVSPRLFTALSRASQLGQTHYIRSTARKLLLQNNIKGDPVGSPFMGKSD